MDLEDEMEYGDVSDVDMYNDSGEDIDGYDDEDEELGGTYDENAQRKKSYTILNEADMKQRQAEDIQNVSNVLSVSIGWASILLCHYDWSVSKVHEEWYEDEEKVRKVVGLLDKPVVVVPRNENKRKKFKCKICLEMYPLARMDAVACGHLFCVQCWTSYVRISIWDGPGCLKLRCPEPSCNAAVGQDMVNKLVIDEDKEKYLRFFYRSYVEVNRKTKWCPGPGCSYAVCFDATTCSDRYDVHCKCSYSFCWNCSEEAHSPVDCDTVAKWILKNTDESENTTWILVNSKPCPQCKRPIQKNEGCMHMTCGAPCRYEFCWLCLGLWREHGGNYYDCNTYKREKEEGKHEEGDRRREMAKLHLEKYAHYYERWAANHKSRGIALADLEKMQSVKIERLHKVQGNPVTELAFIVEAWQQIVECRRVLKWTYAYGYYLPDEKEEKAKIKLFEYLQGEAESALERLHRCAERELEVFLNAEGPSEGFKDFREKLLGLTKVTGNYFENLVQAFENRLSDVDAQCVRSGEENSYLKFLEERIVSL